MRWASTISRAGYPGANPVDTAFFEAPPRLRAKLTAFGMTKRAGRSASNDPGFQTVIQANAAAVCLVAKSWDYHVEVALGITGEENLDAIAASVEAIRCQGARGARRLRTFLRRLQSQSGLCAFLRESSL